MGRPHLRSKKELGRKLDQVNLSIGRQLARLAAQANAQNAGPEEESAEIAAPTLQSRAYWGEPAAPAVAVADEEASLIEDLAVYEGADVLFAKGKEGPITALAIILIPEENRENRRIAALAANFGFVAHISKRKKIAVAVPEGYVTDFASIPGLVHWLISPFGKHAEAAVVHDWLYTLGTRGDGKARYIADRTFRRALHLVGVGFFRRWIMYLAVRIGGGAGFGLPSDYDFRDLVELKQRNPLPDKASFGYTWKEADIPRPQRPNRKRAPQPVPQVSPTEAKQEAQETMVATQTR